MTKMCYMHESSEWWMHPLTLLRARRSAILAEASLVSNDYGYPNLTFTDTPTMTDMKENTNREQV